MICNLLGDIHNVYIDYLLEMDKAIYVVEGVGEYGLDLDHSPGQGGYYVKLYDGSYDASGFESEKEAREELELLIS